MKERSNEQVKFYAEIAGTQLSAKEFFSDALLESIDRNFGMRNVLVLFYDTKGGFLSWRTERGIEVNYEGHPYQKVVNENRIRKVIYAEAVRDKLTYYNVIPRLYKSTDLISKEVYEEDSYVRFLQENFNAYYSVTMAFGIDAYIEVVFFKTREAGDFTNEEMHQLEDIYVFLANGYTTYKKHEQSKIVSYLQNKVIEKKESAYIIIDDFLHVMNYNEPALEYLKDVLGPDIEGQMEYSNTSYWIQLLLGSSEQCDPKVAQVRKIKDYIFTIHTHDQTYSNKIIDRYHWITISVAGEVREIITFEDVNFTKKEQVVAELILQGLTYNMIADKLIISYHTVKKHVHNVYTKCGVNSRFEFYKWYEKNTDKN